MRHGREARPVLALAVSHSSLLFTHSSSPTPPPARPQKPHLVKFAAHVCLPIPLSAAAPFGPAPRLVARPGFHDCAGMACRAGCAGTWQATVAGHARQPERAPDRCRSADAAGHRRQRVAGGAVPRLGNAALRPVQPAPGHHFAASGCPAPPAHADARHRGGAGADAAAAVGATEFHRRWQLRPEGGPASGHGRGKAAAGKRRLPQCGAGAGPG
ncbi:hypothetical protein D3C81_1638360 [compost metagenome]